MFYLLYYTVCAALVVRTKGIALRAVAACPLSVENRFLLSVLPSSLQEVWSHTL